MVLRSEYAPESSEEWELGQVSLNKIPLNSMVNSRLLKPISDSVGMGWGPKICTSKKFLAAAAGQETNFENNCWILKML